MIQITDNRPLFQLTVKEFMELQKIVVPEVQQIELQKSCAPRLKINGIRGLAKFLEVSVPTAQRLKNQMKFNFYTSGNKCFFYSDEVCNGLKVNAKIKGGQKHEK
jgi:hypothetical protein